MTDDARRREDAAIRTEQKLADFIDQYDKDQIAYQGDQTHARNWRKSHDLAHVTFMKDQEGAIASLKTDQAAALTTLEQKLEDRIKPIEDLCKVLTTPAKMLGGVIVLMLTPVLGVFGWNLFKWAVQLFSKVTDNGHP